MSDVVDTPIKSKSFNSEFGGGGLQDEENNFYMKKDISRLSSKVQLVNGSQPPASQELLSPNK